MRTPMRRTAAGLALVCAFALAPLGARADHCHPYIYVHTLVAGVFPPPQFGCIIDPSGHDVDWRIVNPGSTSLSVQYLQDVGASRPELAGTLNGLGFENTPFTLIRRNDGAGFNYQSDTIPIPAGGTASGTLGVEIVIDPEYPETACWHTIGASCPDFP